MSLFFWLAKYGGGELPPAPPPPPVPTAMYNKVFIIPQCSRPNRE